MSKRPGRVYSQARLDAIRGKPGKQWAKKTTKKRRKDKKRKGRDNSSGGVTV